VVKNGFYIHNHPVTPDTFKTYASSRGIQSGVNQVTVQNMISGGVKRSKIYDFLLSHNENVTAKDVDNLLAKQSTKISSTKDNDATALEIAKFMTEDPENASTINETEGGLTGVISLTTKMMRKVYTRFPEFLLVDCTHKTNR
jgi:hypothetical protein